MDNSLLLFGFLPLLIFVVVDTFSSSKAALISALVLATAELVYTLVMFKSLDWITGVVFLLIAVTALASLKTKNIKFFLYQPLLVNILFICVLLISYYMGEPLLKSLAIKYKDIVPEQLKANYNNPIFLKQLELTTLYFGLLLIPQGLLIWYFAAKEKKWLWIITRGVGFYVVMIIAIFWAIFKVR